MKNNKNIKRILWICMCIILIAIVYEIIHIYAVFQSEMEGNARFENGKWNIYVNGTEISKGVETSFLVDQINIDGSLHVKEGNLAPGLAGDFEIAINPSNTDVSVRYDININKESMTDDNIQIVGIVETIENNTLVRTDENTYSAIIPLNKIKNGTTNNIKISLQWIDSDENSSEDINIGTASNPKLHIPITVHVSQYLGEELTKYIENNGE